MKSFFKRTLATATGSVLALGQLVSIAANVNVSAADTSALTVDKDSVLFVPFDEADPLSADQSSNWNDKVESKFLELGSHDYVCSSQMVKEKVRKVLTKKAFSKYLSAADVDALVAQIDSEITGKSEADGTFELTLKINEIGDIVGDLTKELYTISGSGLIDDAGDPIIVDWSDFKMNGKVVVFGQIDFENKTISYQTKIVDENGKEYLNDAGIEQYAKDKLDQATKVALAAADGRSAEGYVNRVNELSAAMQNRIGYIREIADALTTFARPESWAENEDGVIEIGVDEDASGYDSADAAYAAYMEALGEAIEKANVPETIASRVKAAIEKRAPQSASSAVASDRFGMWVDWAADALNKNNLGVTFNVSSADAQDVVANGYDFSIGFFDGYSGGASFKYEDVEAGDVLDAIKAVYTDDGLIEGAELKELADLAQNDSYMDYTVVDGSGVEITDFDKDYMIVDISSYKQILGVALTEYGVKGDLYFDVNREIEQIIVEEVKDTTSTTTTSTTESTTTTTESSTTDTTSTTESTTTTLATYVSFEVGANGNNELIYWSEETDATFDFTKIQVKAHFVVAGEDQTEDIVDVSQYFGAAANSPAELIEAGHEVTTPEKVAVELVLKDQAALEQIITEKGYDAAAIMADQNFANGNAVSYFYVVLVLRGDTSLDGEVSANDAQWALNYYVDFLVQKGPKSTIIKEALLTNQTDPMGVLPYSHYAMDVNGDGTISAGDSQIILQYYIHRLVQANKTWDYFYDGTHIIPRDPLHADPFTYDDLATADYAKYREEQ